jgi:hypothetical protein
VLPLAQAKPTIHGETRGGALAGFVEKVNRVTITTTKNAATSRINDLPRQPASRYALVRSDPDEGDRQHELQEGGTPRQ